MGNSTLVTAKEVKNADHPVKAVYIDENGIKANTVTGESLHGGKWRTLTYSVTVKGINRKLSSAESTHWHTDRKYGDKTHVRSWKK